jgi:hypothetical protein
MENHMHCSLKAVLRLVSFFLIGLAPLSMAQAASVAIDTLSVNSASLSIAITGDGTYNFSSPVSPPATITMGTYQDPIVAGTDWKIYSSPLSGNPAPTGSVDAALGTINVDFSSLRGQATLPTYGLLDFELWPLTTPPSSGTYNATTGQFTLNWSDPFSITLAGVPNPVSGIATVSLSGTVAPVPLPAALWLMGSGLIGLVGAVRRKQARA